MRLEKELFSQVIENTPLISIDLIVQNSSKILLGKRVNEPAKGFWFVPGGRIFKDESLNQAFERTVQEELSLHVKREESQFLGNYEHFYTNNVFDNTFSTHYIVQAYKIEVNGEIRLNNQHEEYRWFELDELLKSEQVHNYTKDYFKDKK